MDKQERKVIYEPHPVSPEHKAELLAQGYKIMDAIYAPAEEAAPADPAQDPAPEPAPAAVKSQQIVPKTVKKKTKPKGRK